MANQTNVEGVETKKNNQPLPTGIGKAKHSNQKAEIESEIEDQPELMTSDILDPRKMIREDKISLHKISYNSKDLSQKLIETLAKSMEEVGLIARPVVREIATERFDTIAGNYRVAAANLLGWKAIRVFVLKPEYEAFAPLIKADENLVRRQLSALEQGELLRQRKEAMKSEGYLKSRGGDRRSRKFKDQDLVFESFAASLSPVLGVSESKINEYVSFAEKIPTDLKAQIFASKLDCGRSDLVEISDLNSSQKRTLSNALLSSPPVNVAELKEIVSSIRGEVASSTKDIVLLISKIEGQSKSLNVAVNGLETKIVAKPNGKTKLDGEAKNKISESVKNLDESVKTLRRLSKTK